jgi:amidohydrolase
MACLLGAARLLVPLRKDFSGLVKLIFQPAEEIDKGAQAMLNDGVLESPEVEALFGLHNYPGVPTGCIASRPGPMMASIDNFRIHVRGEAAHSAVPQNAADALFVASLITIQLHTLVGQNISPLQQAVISVCKFHAGTANNIIADKAEASGSLRTMDPHVREILKQRMQEIVEKTSESQNTIGNLEFQKGIPVLINDLFATQLVVQAVKQLLGNQAVREAEATMGGDDIAFMLERVPGCYFWLGATRSNSTARQWHTANFDIDERAIPIGSAVLSQAALNFLQYQHP